MVNVGIDSLAIYTPRYAISHAALAAARNVDPDKFHTGLGQYAMSVAAPGEDIVTMAANAAKQVLQGIDVNDIEMLLFATESGIDQSKAAGIFVHGLLNLPARCRVVELKQACYSGTAAIQLALPFLRLNPSKKVLVIASDIARYGLNTTGESSQGAGAAALLLSANPRLLAFEPEYGAVTENVMDFWRPNYLHEALVDGKYSSKLYLQMLEKSWQQYSELSKRHFADHDYFCYHTPVPRLVEKAHQYLIKVTSQSITADIAEKQVSDALQYGRQLGNSYSASLYISLASLFDHHAENMAGKRIGFYSYGSGCVAEFFSGVVQSGYQDVLHTDYHKQLLVSRTQLTYDEYAHFYQFNYVEDGSEQEIPHYNTGEFRLSKMQQHKRVYEKVDAADVFLSMTSKATGEGANASSAVRSAMGASTPEAAKEEMKEAAAARSSKANIIKINAPGKLILSGEHSVVYGQPAIAMAVNRYVTATVTHESVPNVLFDLSDLSHHSHLTFDALHHLKDKIKQKYYRFIRGDYSIREVLQKPFELAQFAMGVLAESLNLNLPHGVKIHVQSNLPMGCGMGSSAATILSVMQAITNYMHLPISQEKLYQLALEAENMQHGHSSGLDLQIAMLGGCLYMHGENISPRTIPNMPMYLVNTGTPDSTTGQCVEKVAPHFKSGLLTNEFAAVTNALDAALTKQSIQDTKDAVRYNHKLLTTIGVVPARVQSFVTQAEEAGFAGKICGAGSISGESAGAVLVIAEDQQSVTSLSKRYGYNVIPISGESRGIHAA